MIHLSNSRKTRSKRPRFLQPQEIEAFYVIPTIRKEFARVMKEKYNISQREIAEILGISEAAVSQYFKNKRGYHVDLEKHQHIIKVIEQEVHDVLHHQKSIIIAIQTVVNIIRNSKLLCTIHMEYGIVDPECDICHRFEKANEENLPKTFKIDELQVIN